jgi:hypothetical protein
MAKAKRNTITRVRMSVAARKRNKKVKKTKIWDKLEEETVKAYDYFCVYLSQDPTTRSISKMPGIIKRTRGKEISTAYFYRLSVKFHWGDRVNAHDEEMIAKRLASQEKMRYFMNKRLAEESVEKQEVLSLVNKAVRKKLERNPDVLDDLINLPLEVLIDRLSEIVDPYTKLVNIERIARGEVTERKESKDKITARSEVKIEKVEKFKVKLKNIERKIEKKEYK